MIYGISKFLAFIFIKPFYRMKVFGKKNLEEGSGVIVCNHYRMLDVIMLGLTMKGRFVFVGKKELFKNKLLGWYLRKLGGVPIDRGGSDVKGIMKILKALKAGKKVVIFPEGTRNKTGEELQDVKGGAGMFAVKSKSPIYTFMFHKPSRAFKKNYLIMKEGYTLDEYYGQKLTSEKIDEISNVVKDKMLLAREELKQLVEGTNKKRIKENKSE